MYKVLLVDDERIITEGMSKVIKWESNGAKLIGIARNGLEGYEMIEKQRPDIVISDIKMPGLDGLELVEKTHRTFPDIRFILLSGFSEFGYAKKAMQFGVRHYLLKPCNENVIVNAMKEIQEEIRLRKEHDKRFREIGQANELYKQALESFGGRSYAGEATIITKSETDPDFPDDEHALCRLIKKGNWPEVQNEMGNFFNRLGERDLETHQTLSSSIRLFQAMARLAEETHRNHLLSELPSLLEMDTIQKMHMFCEEIAKEITEIHYKQNMKRFSTMINKVIDIIDENISDPSLSLQKVANEMLYMNADYLGKLFKKEVGEKFSNYLTRIRIEHAIRLIEMEGDVKVFELAEKIGFGGNPQYFSQVFKKQTGYTPSEYKRESG